MQMEQTMRWFGPGDTVPLRYLRQAGCTGVVTALHHIAPGEVWPVAAIMERRQLIEAAGMTWTVAESLPVSEDIKRQSGDYRRHIENYKESLRNLAACGLKVITYNFMPVLDWVRTHIDYPMEDGSRALYFERAAFVAFDLFQLQRPDAALDYDAATIKKARLRYEAMPAEERERLYRNALLGLPGTDGQFTAEEVLHALATYKDIDADKLRRHLCAFLSAVTPVAEVLGLQLAIHPDDPPYPVLGLPRVVSTEADIQYLFDAVPSVANGLCFCTGSFGARADNDLPGMIQRLGDRIVFLHLRNTKRDAEGNFYEAAHLAGDADMYVIVNEIALLMQRRHASIPMRPDHGHQMLDDLDKTTYPGYSVIGRLKGLAELRGLETGVLRHLFTLLVLLLTAFSMPVPAKQNAGHPALNKQGSAVQLVVKDAPFLIRGGELGNSSASSVGYMQELWSTVGQKHLILLWFGSWKNSMSCNVPSWVKKDPQRFPMALKSDGTGQEILSAFSPQNLVADAKAFRALMQHIHEMDAREKIEWRSDGTGTACPYSFRRMGDSADKVISV